MTATTHTIKQIPPTLAAKELGFFRWGRVGDKIMLSNEVGEWELLSEPDFQDFLAGRIGPGHPLRERLVRKCFLREGAELDALAERLARKKSFVGRGPHLHIIVTTLRCTQSCTYCHASRRGMAQVETDMSPASARAAVDQAMRSPSPFLNFEFQGGEPMANMDAIKLVVEYATERNRWEKKQIEFSLVTNMTLMDEERAEWLIAHDVQICTSLDGPKDLHDGNRPWRKGSSSFDETIRWMQYFDRRYVELGRDPRLWHVDALLTVTRETLRRADEVIDFYIERGLRNLHLRPLNHFGFAQAAWDRLGYSGAEFDAFYFEALDSILQRNLDGIEIMEGGAAVVLGKLLTPDDPGFVDLQSPCGAGTGQLAYDYDGTVYPCDEARLAAAGGDRLFAMGQSRVGSQQELAQHPTVRALGVASLLESLPGCADCWNAPYCGVCPVHNYMVCGDLFGQRPGDPRCERQLKLTTWLLRRLDEDEDGKVERIFRRWTTRRQVEE